MRQYHALSVSHRLFPLVALFSTFVSESFFFFFFCAVSTVKLVVMREKYSGQEVTRFKKQV